MPVSDEERNAFLNLLPTDGRGIGNVVVMRELDWGERQYNRVKQALIDEGVIKPGPGQGGSVKRFDAAEDEQKLVDSVPKDGSLISNAALREELGWDEEMYYRIRDRLVDAGVLERGRGRGGSVRRLHREDGDDRRSREPAGSGIRVIEREEELYPRIAKVLKESWARERGFSWWKVEQTAKQGRRDTGGRWTRPDFAGVSIRKFPYVPGQHIDVWSFEVKTMDGLDVTAVYEALAHARFATRAYVVVKVPEKPTRDEEQRLEAVKEDAARYGIGVITMIDPADYDSWEERVESKRFESSPERINDFIATQFSEETKSELAMQYR